MKEDLRVIRTHRLLSEALIEIMKEIPFEKISVVDICERAMVHRSTFYAHFEDKYQLLKYVMEDFDKAFEREDNTSDNFSGYRKYYLAVAEDIINEVDIKRSGLNAILKKNKRESLIDNAKVLLADKVCDKLKKCENNGTEFSVPAEILSQFYAGACISIMEWWIENPDKVSKEELIEYFNMLIPDR